jgi:hypothetical protein
MKSSILERKIKADPLTWGTPEMIRTAKQRRKSGLSVDLNDNSAGIEPMGAAPSSAPSSKTSQNSAPTLEENKKPTTSIESVPYPEIRAKYDVKIANVKASKAFSQSDKKSRIKHLESRYQNEIKEKTYQKIVAWSFAGFLVIAAILLYVKSTVL